MNWGMNLRGNGVSMMNRIVMALICALYGYNTLAQEADVLKLEPETPPETSISTPSTPFFKPGSWITTIYAGTYDVTDDPQFVGIRNDYALGLGLSAELSRYPNLALDFEYFYINRDYDTPIGPPLFGTIDNDTSLSGGRPILYLCVGWHRLFSYDNGCLRKHTRIAWQL